MVGQTGCCPGSHIENPLLLELQICPVRIYWSFGKALPE